MKTLTFIVCSILLISGWVMSYDGDKGKAVSKKIPEVVVEKGLIDNSILDYDFTSTVYEIPPRYQPEGAINPFTPVVKETPRVKVARLLLPDTPFTKYMVSQLTLTGIVITSSSAYAFFMLPNNGKCYKSTVGDYIGRGGIKIADIKTGSVHLSDGSIIAMSR